MEYNNAFLAPVELASAQFHDAASVYRQGYLERPDRTERFASNLDMETLHSLSPEAGIVFQQKFYAKEAGNYYLARDRESMAELLEEEQFATTR